MVIHLNIEVGNYVTRKSYNNDTVFKVLSIKDDTVYLKGVYVRLYADSKISDLKKIEEIKDEFTFVNPVPESREEYFYLPGKILHIDGDTEYLDKCLKFYKENGVYAIGKKINEEEISNQIINLLEEYRPDIVIITGHDAYYKKKGNKDNVENYKNSKNFAKAIRAARKYEKSQEKLVIIAGACQSDYEELIKSGANFASSPRRVNIHALDPAIIAVSIALTKRNNPIDIVNILDKTRYGSDGIGGIITNGLMYVGFPR
ncbi:MAG: sporulation peptidase YabG [Firmicutes bacterium]|nr:sporulation peptidase YabG [Bacillota bacterium]